MFQKTGVSSLTARITALLFFFSYVSSYFLTQLHQFSHESAQEEVICYEEDNACHLRLIHQDTENGCDHESHFSDELPTCELCPLLQANTEASEQDWRFSLPKFGSNLNAIEKADPAYQNHLFTLSNRGPPVNS